MTPEQLTGLDDSQILWLTPQLGIHQVMKKSWQAMVTAASNDGLSLKIVSGYRSFQRQQSIWNRKYSGELPVKDLQGNNIDLSSLTDTEKLKAILLYSALPSASRHHWGCDIDVYADNLLNAEQKLQLEPWEYEKNGPFYRLSLWLAKNAHLFDFYFPYDKYRGGVAYEPWHLSYHPIAKSCEKLLTANAISQTIVHQQVLGKQAILENINDIYQQYITNVGEK